MSLFDPAAITPELIEKIKKANPGKQLFKWAQMGIIYKPIDRELNDRVMKLSNEAFIKDSGNIPFREIEDLVVSECVLFPKLTPEDRKDIPVGTYTTLNKVIHEKANFIDIDIFNRALGRDSFSETLVDFEYWDDITDEDLEKLKIDYPHAIYRVFVGEYVFIIRQLTRRDVEVCYDKTDPVFEKVKRTVVWPRTINWDGIPAGVVEKVFDELQNVSGFMESKVTIEEL